MKRDIPFFNYRAIVQAQRDELFRAIQDVVEGGRFILQQELEDFEAALADFLGVAHAFGVGNGTDALVLALRASGVERGDEVILPSHTFVATASAVAQVGARPVLVDVRDDHLVDPEAVRRVVTPRTRVIMPVQLNGRTADMDAIQAVADEHGLLVVEDAAQGLGSAFRGRKAGTFGRAAGFSFYPAKLLGCFGDGGGVVTDDAEVADRITTLRNHGRMDDGNVREYSYNSRLDNVQAAILLVKLRHFEGEIRRRREIAAAYDERLRGLPGAVLPPPPTDDGPHFDVFQNYEIELPRRDDVRERLAERGVGTIVQWGGKAVHQFPALGFDVRLPVTERVMSDSLMLPLHPHLSDEEVEYVAAAVVEAADAASRAA